MPRWTSLGMMPRNGDTVVMPDGVVGEYFAADVVGDCKVSSGGTLLFTVGIGIFDHCFRYDLVNWAWRLAPANSGIFEYYAKFPAPNTVSSEERDR